MSAGERDIEVSVAVPLHPSRRGRIEDLAGRLGASELKPTQLTVVEDVYLDGVWPNTRKAWDARNQRGSGTHHLVLEDDVIPCADLIAGAISAISAVEHRAVISMFTTAEKDFVTASEVAGSWVEQPVCVGQALMMPVELADEWLDWQDVHLDPRFGSVDMRVATWAWQNGVPILHTVPSLVEHGGAYQTTAHDARSAGKYSPGYAHRWLGEDRSAAEIDWTRGASPWARPVVKLRAYYKRAMMGLMEAVT